MGQNEKNSKRYFNHGSPKDQPKYWWYFRFLEIGSKSGQRFQNGNFNFNFNLLDQYNTSIK